MEAGSYLVAVHELGDLRVVATWNGRGPYVNVSASTSAGERLVDAWSVWDHEFDTPKLDADLGVFRQFVSERLADPEVADCLRKMLADSLIVDAGDELDEPLVAAL